MKDNAPKNAARKFNAQAREDVERYQRLIDETRQVAKLSRQLLRRTPELFQRSQDEKQQSE
jgi:hypothetical protein